MYIICDSGKRIINTNCVPCIGYEKCGAACNSHYRVFAYSGNAVGEGNEVKYAVGVYSTEELACFIVSYIAEMIQAGADAIKI